MSKQNISSTAITTESSEELVYLANHIRNEKAMKKYEYQIQRDFLLVNENYENELVLKSVLSELEKMGRSEELLLLRSVFLRSTGDNIDEMIQECIIKNLNRTLFTHVLFLKDNLYFEENRMMIDSIKAN